MSQPKEDIHRIALQVLGVLGGLDVLINNASELGRRRCVCSPIPSAKTSSKHSRRMCSVRFD